MRNRVLLIILLGISTILYGQTASESYIPLSVEIKDALFGTSKAITMGVTGSLFGVIHFAPYGKGESSKGIYDFFATTCHQFPARSLTATNGVSFPVCARCQGMYIGYFLGCFDFLIWDAFQGSQLGI